MAPLIGIVPFKRSPPMMRMRSMASLPRRKAPRSTAGGRPPISLQPLILPEKSQNFPSSCGRQKSGLFPDFARRRRGQFLKVYSPSPSGFRRSLPGDVAVSRRALAWAFRLARLARSASSSRSRRDLAPPLAFASSRRPPVMAQDYTGGLRGEILGQACMGFAAMAGSARRSEATVSASLRLSSRTFAAVAQW